MPLRRSLALLGGIGALVLALAGQRLRWSRIPTLHNLDHRRSHPKAHHLWIGDSTAASVGSTSRSTSLPHLVADPDTQITVLAEPGARLLQVIREQIPRIVRHAPTEVFVSIGSNDVLTLTSPTVFQERVKSLLANLPTDLPVVILGLPPLEHMPRIPRPIRPLLAWRTRGFDAVLRDSIESHPESGFIYVPLRDLAYREDARQSIREYLSADGFHESDRAYALWAERIRQAREKP